MFVQKDRIFGYNKGLRTLTLIRYPTLSLDMRSIMSEISEVLTDERYVYNGSLGFRYVVRKYEQERGDINQVFL